MLFGIAGSLSMGKEDQYIIEVRWINGEQSVISITGSTFYQFFISKLYENGTSLILNQMKIEEANNIKEKKQDFQDEIKYLEEEYNLNKKNIDYFEVDIDYRSNLENFLTLLPYYKAEYESNHNDIDKYQNNIKRYNNLINSYEVKANIKKLYKNTSDKVIDCFIVDCNKKYLDNNLTENEKINKIKEVLPIKDLYSDKELKMMLSKTEKENIDYFNRKFVDNELLNYLNDLHKRNGYIYVSKDREYQKTQIEIYKNKIPAKLYNLLNQILEKSINKYDFNLVETDFITVKPDFINEKIIAPSHFLISYFLNCYFGKEENVPIVPRNNGDKYDNIKKIKELLDIGAITLEEYEKEKKQILSN